MKFSVVSRESKYLDFAQERSSFGLLGRNCHRMLMRRILGTFPRSLVQKDLKGIWGAGNET